MGKKSSAPAAPNYGPLIKLATQQAKQSFELSKEQFAWAKQAYAENKEITDQTVDAFLDSMDFNLANARKDRERYESIFQPLEDKFVADAESFDTPERRAQEMGRAKADVAQNFEAARENALRQLEGYGINPSATRFAALDLGTRIAEGAAKAAAGTEAGRYVDDKARMLRAQAIDIGRGLPAQGLAAGAQGTAQGAAAGNSALGTTASGANTMGTPLGWMGIGQQGVSSAGNMMNMGYQNRLAEHEANQAASSGIGGLLGTALGFIPGMGPVSSAIGLFEDGGPVPAEVSPSRGAIPDDVNAKVTAGEFVIPREAVAWFGEKHMHGLIEKAAKERQETTQQTGAIPRIARPPEAPPAALPLR